MEPNFHYGSGQLTIHTTIRLATKKMRGILTAETKERITNSQQHVQDIINQHRTVYGINTGFGILANTPISEQDTRTLQHKILQSHSVGVGAPVPADISRIMLITKVHALAKGYSGVQLSTLE